MDQIVIYTDGACNKQGHGGFGSYFYNPKNKSPYILFEDAVGTTNNRMELLGVIEPLEFILESITLNNEDFSGINIKVVSDSQYVVKGISEWIHNWWKNDWKTAAGKPVKNFDLWIRMDVAVRTLKAHAIQVNFEWVRGHDGHPENEFVDKLANRASTYKSNNKGTETLAEYVILDDKVFKCGKDIGLDKETLILLSSEYHEENLYPSEMFNQ